MPTISPLIVRLFDDPHAGKRRNENHSKKARFESRGRVKRAKRG